MRRNLQNADISAVGTEFNVPPIKMGIVGNKPQKKKKETLLTSESS